VIGPGRQALLQVPHSVIVLDPKGQIAAITVIEAHLSCPGVLCKQGLDSIEGGTLDDRRMLAGMGPAPSRSIELGHDVPRVKA
jgi:hypothetical protein